jgi:tetratricopeptide (TPR) repeat protein
MHSSAYLTPDQDIRQSRRFKVEAAWNGSIEPRPDAMAAGDRSGVDARGCRISGANRAALQAYEDAFATFLGWRSGADLPLASALQQAPAFVMAHVLQAWQLLCSRDPRRVGSARPVLARAAGPPANERERLHLAAIASVLGDDYEGVKTGLGELLHTYPRDALALQAAHALDYVTGDSARMKERVAALLPAWSSELPGYAAVLAMHAFGLEECGDYARAEQVARAALAVDASDARAHHVMAHVFEMTGRADAGVRWMNEHLARWSADTVVATHCWWHLALFHLSQGEWKDALALYDRRVRAARSGEVADLIDAASLLWRIELRGGDAGARWTELAAAWAAHIDDGFCSFNDLHAMLAFVGARDWQRAQRLERALQRRWSLPTRHGATTRQLGLPACRALIAFARGKDALAITLLASLPPLAHRLGGSHAQRDVLHLTLRQALERTRRRYDSKTIRSTSAASWRSGISV